MLCHKNCLEFLKILNFLGLLVTKKWERFVRGVDLPGDGLSRGRIVQKTDRPEDGLSKGRIVKKNRGDGLSGGRIFRGRIIMVPDSML
jgi:hypothetical protein